MLFHSVNGRGGNHLWSTVLLINLEPFLTRVQHYQSNWPGLSFNYSAPDQDHQSDCHSCGFFSTTSYLEEQCSPPLTKSREAASRRITASAQADHRLSLPVKKLYLVVTAHRSFFKLSLHTTWSSTTQTHQFLWFTILQGPQLGVEYSTGSLENASCPFIELLGKFEHIFSSTWESKEPSLCKFRGGTLYFTAHGKMLVTHYLFQL